MAGYDGSFNQLSIPLARGGQNLAPLRPIADAIKNKKTNKEPTKFEQAVRELYTHYLNYEKIAWNEIISMAQLVSLFRKGQQLLVRRPYGPGYYIRPIANDDTYRQTAMNFMNFYSNICESKIVASNPSVNMRAGDDSPEAIAAARACRPVVDYYEGEWYDDKFTRREAIRFLTDGMVIHQVRWNPFKGGYGVQERQVTQQEVQIDDGYGECADCSFGGPAEAFAEGGCPECGSQAIDVAPPQKQSLAQISMGPRKPIGEPEIITSPLAAWRWDLNKDLECSPWAIKRQRITQGAIRLLLGDINIPDAGNGEQYGLDVIHALAYAGQAFQGQSATQWRGKTPSYEKTPTMCEFWISPEDAATLEIEESETVSGVTIPGGSLAKFSGNKPVCLVGLNDMSLIIGAYMGESHQDEAVTAQWFMDADSGVGRGLEDTAGVQKRANAVDGQVYQGLAMGATPTVFVDRRMLTEDDGHYLYRPGQNVYMELAMLPPGLGMKDAVYSPPPVAVNQQYIQYGQVYLKEMAQISSMAVEYGETLLSIDNRTATGAQITAQLANSLFGPMLLGKGMLRVKIAKKIVCLTVTHDVGGRFYPGKEGTHGRLVRKEELQGKVIFELVQNSQLPVTPFSQQTDVRVLMESFQGIQGLIALKQGDAQMFRALTKPFNVPFDSETDDDVSTLCLDRLNQMQQMLQMGVDDPAMLVQGLKPPVSEKEPKHVEKRDWWSYWLDLPTAQKAPIELRQAAEQMWNLHENMKTQLALPQAVNQGMVQGAGMAAAQAPSAMGAQAMGLGQEQQAAEDPTQQIEADMQMEQMNAEKELQLKQMEGETQRSVAQIQAQGQLANTSLQGRNQLENTRLAGENAVKVAKAKPRPKPTAKKTA